MPCGGGAPGETPILYIDRHLVHEVTSPQAFDGLREKGRPVRQVSKTFATMDHNVSTTTKDINASGEMARIQMQTLSKTAKSLASRCTTLTTSTKALCM